MYLLLIYSKSQQDDCSGQQEQAPPFCFKLSLLARVGRPASPYARQIKKCLLPSSFSIPFDIIKNKHSIIGTSIPFTKIIFLKWLPSSDLDSLFPFKSNAFLLVFPCFLPAAQSNWRSLQRKIAHRKMKKLRDVVLLITILQSCSYSPQGK